MRIKRLVIQHVRNIEHVEVDGFDLINFFIGGNGSGKSSFLESLSLLSLGRSFRTNNISTVISHHASELQVFCQAECSVGQVYNIGLSRNKDGNFSIRVNGETLRSLITLSQLIPTLLFNSSSFLLLEGGSSHRSRFIDWGVFHVEHGFYNFWQSHNKALRQRNSLLKGNSIVYSDMEVWDKGITDAAIEIEKLRISYLKEFVLFFRSFCQENDYSMIDDLSFWYQDGWGTRKAIINDSTDTQLLSKQLMLKKLSDSFGRDKKLQRTTRNSKKSDLVVMIDGELVKDVLSRGQLKTLITLLNLCQAMLLIKKTGKKPILLLDDLSAELDEDNFLFITHILYTQQLQSFITCTERNSIPSGKNLVTKSQMFHVKHGKIERI